MGSGCVLNGSWKRNWRVNQEVRPISGGHIESAKNLGNSAVPFESQSTKISGAVVLQCSKCSSERVRRVERKGILERRILKLLGYYPWRCATCRTKFFLKRRSREGGKPKEYAG